MPRDGGAEYREAFAEVFAPRERLDVGQWADRHRVLSGKAASAPGQWRTDRTPYMREPLACLAADSDVAELVLWFGTQLGKTETLLNVAGHTMHQDPGPVMLVQPTLALAKDFSKQRVASLIDDTPVLRHLVEPARARDSGNTLLTKSFRGGILRIVGANSASGLRSMPARTLLFDEIDAYPLNVGGEGDPISLAEKRADTFGSTRKSIKTSTCTIKGQSRIEQAYARSDQRRYHVPCPHCDAYQVLAWSGVKWTLTPEEGGGDRIDVHYACAHCGALIDERAKPDMLARGRWIAEAPGVRVRGYWLNSLYSPLGWTSWARLVREFLDAKVASDAGDPTLLQVFTNTRLAQVWELKGSTLEPSEVQKCAEPYALRTIPRGVLVITGSVDVQGDRLEYLLLGWGAGEECWILDYGKLYGDPAEPIVWQRLDDEILKPTHRNAFGLPLKVSAAAIDHGGHHAAQVEAFTRPRAGRHVLAVKGQSQPSKPIIGKPNERDTSWRGKKIKRGARVWPVGSDTAKFVLYHRLDLTTQAHAKGRVGGPGYLHTSDELDDAFYAGLTAEQLVRRYVKGRPIDEWHVKAGVRNEPLDLWVYGYAAFAYLGGTRWKENDWRTLADRIEPPLFAPPSAPATADAPPPPGEPPPAPEPADREDEQEAAPAARDTKPPATRRPTPRRRGGFVHGWKRPR